MPGVPPCSAGSRAATCGRDAKSTAPGRPASSAIPTSSVRTAPEAVGSRPLRTWPAPWRRPGPPDAVPGPRRTSCARGASRCCNLTPRPSTPSTGRVQRRRRDQRDPAGPTRPRLGLCQPQSGRRTQARPRPRAQARLPPARGAARSLRGHELRAVLAPTNGRPGPRREHIAGRRVLPGPPAVAPQPADPQVPGDPMTMDVPRGF